MRPKLNVAFKLHKRTPGWVGGHVAVFHSYNTTSTNNTTDNNANDSKGNLLLFKNV